MLFFPTTHIAQPRDDRPAANPCVFPRSPHLKRGEHIIPRCGLLRLLVVEDSVLSVVHCVRSARNRCHVGTPAQSLDTLSSKMRRILLIPHRKLVWVSEGGCRTTCTDGMMTSFECGPYALTQLSSMLSVAAGVTDAA